MEWKVARKERPSCEEAERWMDEVTVASYQRSSEERVEGDGGGWEDDDEVRIRWA